MSGRFRAVILSASACFILLCAGANAQAADFPTGTFTAKVMGMDIALTFDAKGKFKVEVAGTLVADGSYKVNKDMFELTDEGGPGAEKENGAGKYKWKYEKNMLTFTLIEDKSKDRAAALSMPWTLKK